MSIIKYFIFLLLATQYVLSDGIFNSRSGKYLESIGSLVSSIVIYGFYTIIFIFICSLISLIISPFFESKEHSF